MKNAENEGSERMSAVLSLLPESIRDVADTGTQWIKDHPTEAFVIGTIGGFVFGAVGIGRALVAARFLRSVPQIVPVVLAGVAVLAEKFESSKAERERVTH